MATTPRGRRGWGTARHFRSAEREDDGVPNVLCRGEYVCAMLLTYIYFPTYISRCSHSTSGCFAFPTTSHFLTTTHPYCPCLPFYLGVIYVLFAKKYQKHWPCVFEGVCPRRAETPSLLLWSLRGVSLSLARPAFFPQNPTAILFREGTESTAVSL